MQVQEKTREKLIFSELSHEQNIAFEKYRQGKNIFITGPGGTGKTTLIRKIYDDAINRNKKIHVTALTGCAAILLNCKATTLHSWAGVGLCNGTVESNVMKIVNNTFKKKKWRETNVLVVDEVSMMSLKLFNVLNCIGKIIRKNNKPFGGIQIIFAGDFYQLPPVGNKDDIETSSFCFESEDWNNVFSFDCQIELKKIFRQTEETYTTILNQIREGVIKKKTNNILLGYVKREKPQELLIEPTKLLPTRKQVENINNFKMESLGNVEMREYKLKYITNIESEKEKESGIKIVKYVDSDSVNSSDSDSVNNSDNNSVNSSDNNSVNNSDNNSVNNSDNNIMNSNDNSKTSEKNVKFIGSKVTEQMIQTELEFLSNNLICDDLIKLKKGSQVMCVVNIKADSGDILLCNGSQGIVVDFCGYTSLPIVKFNNGILMTMNRHVWESENVPGIGVSQIPLILAWALTIHKSQGASLDAAEIDVGSNIFECGQTYVALSRVRSLEGLYLNSFDVGKIKINRKVKMFYEKLRAYKEIEEHDNNNTNTNVKIVNLGKNPFDNFRYNV